MNSRLNVDSEFRTLAGFPKI
ncbi:hypothetical protein RSAG8_08115, partial [Rhizoctonia solani AG-8 WAC10335]